MCLKDRVELVVVVAVHDDLLGAEVFGDSASEMRLVLDFGGRVYGEESPVFL